MCGSKGGGSPPVPSAASTTFNSTVRPNPTVEPLYTDFLNRANSLSNTPFNPAMLGQVAPMNAQQLQAGNQLFNLGMDMGNFDPAKVQSIMSPFTQNVVEKTQAWFNNANAIQGNDLLSQAIKSGNAFGGDRAGAAEGILAGQQQLAQAPVIAGLYERGYGQALDEYNRLKQFGLQGAGAALGWGGLTQAQQQREFDVAQQNAMMQSAYPFQTLNWYGSILGGIGPLLGQQAFGANNPPEQSGLGTALGIGGAAIGLGSTLAGSGGGGGTGPAQGKYGGDVDHLERRAQGGLVPVHHFEYGGSPPYSDDDEKRDKDEGRPDYHYDDSRPASPNEPDFGLSKGWSKPTSPGPQFPGFPGGTGGQKDQKSDTQQWLEFGTKAVTALAPLMMASDPKIKTDVQRIGEDDDGEDLYAFRYRGDPKSYPKVVGHMAVPPHAADGGWVIPHLADAGEVMSDESEYPIEPGQQYARDYAGRTTWFNPRNEVGGYTYRDESGQDWTDYGAMRNREGRHASGLPSTTPGFASPGSSDLGNYFRVTGPGGVTTIARKTDIGPAGVVDLNAPLAAQMYGRPGAVPSGRTYAQDLGRNPPAGADATGTATNWPDPSKGNVGTENLPSPDQPSTPAWRVPGSRQGRAEPTPDQGAGGPQGPRGVGTGPVGGTIPGRPEQTFAQRLATNPFWQLGTALMARPGIKGREGSAVGSALMSMNEQQLAQRKLDLLDSKPELINQGGDLFWRVGDKLTPTGMKSESWQREEFERKTQRPFDITTEKPGRFGTTDTVKRTYRYDREGNLVPVPDQPAETDQAPLPPPSPPAPQPAPAPQVRQSQSAEPPAAAPVAPAAAPGAPQAPPPITTVATRPTAQQNAPEPPAGGRTGGAQLPQVAQAQPAAAAGPVAPGLETGEAAWKTHIMPAGRVTNPDAMEQYRNPAAIAHLSPEDQRDIKAVADYTLDPNKMYPGQKNTRLREALTGWARAYDPQYNPANVNARAKALVEYGVNGKAQQNLQSNSMVLEHLGDAMTAVDKIGNSTVPIWNKVTGQWQYQTGDAKYQAAVSALRTAGHAAATETAKTLRGVGSMSERETALWSQILLGSDDNIVSASPVTMRAALKELTGLVAGRLNATAEGYNQIMGPQYERSAESWMTPKAKETFVRSRAVGDPADNKPFPPSRFKETQTGPAGPGGGGGGGQPVQVQSMDDVRKLQPGQTFIIPDGPSKGMIGTVPQRQ